MDDLEGRLGQLVRDAAGEAVGEPRLPRLEHAHAEARALVQQRSHLRAPVDRDQHERRPQRDGHERVRRHPVHLLGDTRASERSRPWRTSRASCGTRGRDRPSSPSPSSSASLSGAASNDAPNASGAEIASETSIANSGGFEPSIATDSLSWTVLGSPLSGCDTGASDQGAHRRRVGERRRPGHGGALGVVGSRRQPHRHVHAGRTSTGPFGRRARRSASGAASRSWSASSSCERCTASSSRTPRSSRR